MTREPGVRMRPRRSWPCDLAAPCLLLLTPLLVFLKHNNYGLLRPETLLCYALFVAVGLLLGLIMILGRTPARVIIPALLAAYVLDMAVRDLRPPVLLATLLGAGVVAWLLRPQTNRVAALLAGAMLVTTLLLPGNRQPSPQGPPRAGNAARADLPFILHLILDAHIGIEGIPAEFDPDRRLAGELRDFLVDNGFEVYGRAYSHYFNTEDSVSNLFNFAASPEPSHHFPAPFRMGATLARNAWIDSLGQRGYAIYAIQSDFLHFVAESAPVDGGERPVTLNYTLETIASIEHAPLAAVEKARFITGIHLRLCDTLTWGLTRYANLRSRLSGRGITLPFWRETHNRTSTLSSRRMLARLREDLRTAGPGQAYLVHVMLPHGPYPYEADGTLRRRGREWRFGLDRTKAPHRNDAASRAASYPQYLDQVRLTREELSQIFAVLRERGLWDDAIVVLHGDHGSRITLEWPTGANRDCLSEADLVDGFSSLFAVKRPGVPGRYDRRLLPLEHLAARILRDGAEPGDPVLETRPFVWLADGRNPMIPLAMPDFGSAPPPLVVGDGRPGTDESLRRPAD